RHTEQPPLHHSRRARESRRGEQWPRGDDQFAGERTRHPHDPFHHLPEEGPRHAHGGSPLRDPRRESRGGTRLRVRDLGRRRPGGRSRDGPLANRALPGSRAVPAGGLATAAPREARVAVPLIGAAMFPGSNPELVAAVSEAGGIGIVQPLSMVYVHGHELREGFRLIRRLTPKPIGMNVLIEQSSRLYLDRMQRWVDVAIEEGVRFFITSLGKPRWVVDRVAQVGGLVYHDVPARKWALKGLASG